MKSRWCAIRRMLLLGLVCCLAAVSPCLATAVDLVPAVGVTTWPDSPYRWKDIAPNTYTSSYQAAYLYDDATVTVTYEPVGHLTLTGHLSATNLKPNFAYQMKLVGKPTSLFPVDGDDATNERLGYVGRWWRNQPNPGNSNDADYEAHHDDPAYIFEGYLVFGFFVSDTDGNAEVDFEIDSSYHVLWWEHQRTPGTCDSPVLTSSVIGHASHPAYDVDVGPAVVGVFAEIERLCTGTTSMPIGTYNCRFLLTEESFHQSGEGDGYWASALVSDAIQFEVSDLTAVGTQVGDPSIICEPLQPNPFHGRTVLSYELVESQPVRFSIYDLSGRLIRSLTSGLAGTGRHQLAWDGRTLGGRRAPAGLYLYRVEIPAGCAEAGKVILLK